MDKILEYVRKAGRPVYPYEIIENLEFDKKQVENSLKEMVNNFSLMLMEDGRVVLPKQMGLCIGKISCHHKGFAFVLQEDDDIFIPAENLNYAMDSDIVSVRLYNGKRRGNSKEGKVVSIISRANQDLIGTLTEKNGQVYLAAKNKKILNEIKIDNLKDAAMDDVVIVKLIKYPCKKHCATANVTQVIGKVGDEKIDIACNIAAFNLPNIFNKNTLKEAQATPKTVTDITNRQDFRDELTITIDGDDSKDFDDAVYLDYDGEYYNLKVHIADVSHYVKPNSSLDKDAYLRGNSVYFPGTVIPMLPFELSNGICSLNPKEDRFAMSCIMKIDQDGRVIDSSITRSVINSKYRMTYGNVNKILGKDKEVCQEYSEILPMIENMNNLKQILFNARLKKGSLEFDLPEAKFILDQTGKPIDILKRTRGNSEQLIEEFMLIANRTVCEYLIANKLPCAYRVHEVPSEEKLDNFASLVNAYGFKLIKQNITPKKVQNLLNEIKGTPQESAISTLCLRTLQKARYSDTNHHHFGLAFENYCHFTSPIRRYADLIVHRILGASLDNEQLKMGNLEKICDHISETEKIAMEAEHKINDLYKCYYLKQFVGEEFEGTISGMNNSGFYVCLDNTCEGMVRLSDIKGDYYVFNDKLFHIIGERTKKMFKMGQKVKVLLSKVNEEMAQVDMTLIYD